MKRLSLLIIFTLSTIGIFSQEHDDKKDEGQRICSPGFGCSYFAIEQDVLPYVFNGYMVSVLHGSGATRKRLSFTKFNIPRFYLDDALKTNKISVLSLNYEIFLERFKCHRGLWIGPGIGYWSNRILTNDGIQSKNNSVVLTAGVGYNLLLHRFKPRSFFYSLYLSPWVAGHFRVTGTESIEIGNYTYQPRIFTPEVSVKIGFEFRYD